MEVQEPSRPSDNKISLRINDLQQAGKLLDATPYSPLAEENIYYHPHFLKPALQALGSNQCKLLTLNDNACNDQSPLLVWPFEKVIPGFGIGRSVLRGWMNIYSTQGTPLVFSENEYELNALLEELLHLLASPQVTLPSIIMLPQIWLDQPVAQTLLQLAQQRNLPVRIIDQQQRAVLIRSTSTSGKSSEDIIENYLAAAIGKNHRREYRRLWRRLAETGDLSYQISIHPAAIERDFETFLSLEAAGWKGDRNSAISTNRQHATFARQAVKALAADGLVRIHLLLLDGKTIASLVVFVQGDQAWTWKTAYDESLKAYSPGVLLMIELLKTHLADPHIRLTDSCAIPDHPVMSRLFKERETIATLLIGLRPDTERAMRQVEWQIRLYQKLRKLAQNCYRYWRKK